MADEAGEQSALPPVATEAFSGPLDLLLHLIRVNQVSITDIPIARITEQYTAYLDAMQELDLDVASEYVALAAELIYIKSRMLLPRGSGGAGRGPAPGARPAAPRVRAVQADGRVVPRDRLAAGGALAAPRDAAPDGRRERDARGLALRPDRGIPPASRSVTGSRIRRRWRSITCVSPCARRWRSSWRGWTRERTLPLLEFLGTMRYRAEAVTAFLAALELIRLGVVRVFQTAPFARDPRHADGRALLGGAGAGYLQMMLSDSVDFGDRSIC